MSVGLALGVVSAVSAASALETVKEVLDLPRAAALSGRPVRLGGMVLVTSAPPNTVYLADLTAVVRVQGVTNPVGLRDLVVVEGRTTAGFAPEVVAERVERTGSAPWPIPLRILRSDLITGEHEHQWRQVAGVVTRVADRTNATLVTLTVAGGHVDTMVYGPGRAAVVTNWMHHQVSIAGVVRVLTNYAGQLNGAALLVPGVEHVRVAAGDDGGGTNLTMTAVQVESTDPTMVAVKGLTNALPEPAQAIAAELMQYGTTSRRVRALGTVLYQSRSNRVFCVDATGPLRVNLRQAEAFAPGERLEILGYPMSAEYRSWLVDAEVHRLGPGSLPAPVRLTAVRALKGKWDSQRITLRGVVVGHDDLQVRDRAREVVYVQDGSVVFRANFDSGVNPWSHLPIGAEVELTGLGLVDNLTREGGTGLGIYLSSLADALVVRGPPFWSAKRLALFAGVLGLLLAGGVGWVVLQRRQFALVRASEERSFQVLRRINEFGTSLSPIHTEDDVLWEITRQCISVLGFSDCVIYLIDEDRGVLVQRAAYGPKNPRDRVILDPIEIPVGKGIVGTVASTGKPELVSDTRKDARYIADDAVRLSEIAVPIVAGERVLGVIDSEHPQVGFFREDHLQVLESIASLCANKLVRARAEQRLKQWNAELETRITRRTTELRTTNEQLRAKVEERARAEKVQKAVYQISEAVHAVETLPSLYERIHSIVGTLMPAGNFYLALLDPVTQIVSFPYHRDRTDPPPTPRRMGRGMTEYVLRTGRATLADWAEIRRLKEAGEYLQTGHPARIWLGVPLTLQGRTFGVMAVQDHDDEQAFGEEEKQLLSFVAEQTALAIERKRAEAELRASADRLRQSEERFSKAFHSSPIILSIARLADGRFLDVNEAFLTALGMTREEVIGRTAMDVGIWRTPEARETFVRQLREHGSVRNREFTVLKRGEPRTLMLSAELIVIGDDPCVVSVSADITERQQAEAELLRTLARERELNQLKSRFVATISHEFRTPLGIVLSSADILQRYFDRLNADQRREHLGDIQESALGMARQMENVLVFGRIEANRLECNPVPVNLVALCQRLIQQTATVTEQQSPIRLACPDAFPVVEADEALISHVLTNLLSNAVKYSPAGAPVDCEVSREGDWVVLQVRDRGMGIPARDRDHLFMPFQRGSNVGRVPGTGMGLTIVKRCMDLHGGETRIESEERVGTTVTVRWRGLESRLLP